MNGILIHINNPLERGGSFSPLNLVFRLGNEIPALWVFPIGIVTVTIEKGAGSIELHTSFERQSSTLGRYILQCIYTTCRQQFSCFFKVGTDFLYTLIVSGTLEWNWRYIFVRIERTVRKYNHRPVQSYQIEIEVSPQKISPSLEITHFHLGKLLVFGYILQYDVGLTDSFIAIGPRIKPWVRFFHFIIKYSISIRYKRNDCFIWAQSTGQCRRPSPTIHKYWFIGKKSSRSIDILFRSGAGKENGVQCGLIVHILVNVQVFFARTEHNAWNQNNGYCGYSAKKTEFSFIISKFYHNCQVILEWKIKL